MSTGLEDAGRLREVYEAIVKAESLITKDDHPRVVAHIREEKAWLLKLISTALELTAC